MQNEGKQVVVRGLGISYGLTLDPTDKAKSLNIKDRKSGPYISEFKLIILIMFNFYTKEKK